MAKHTRTKSADSITHTPPHLSYPAVSVVIPLYNAEKYIAECLDSLLAQTFQDFELIVVDDCSTDKSCDVVKNYAPRFGGRLTLKRTKKNSGGGGYVPRNLGLGLSHGEYIYFVDADDFIAKNALEILHAAAKNTGADVVYNASYYEYTEKKEIVLERDGQGRFLLQKGIEDRPTLTIDNPNMNLQGLLLGGGWTHMPWTKFVKREFLIENEIAFPKIFSGGDFIWTIQVFYHTKKLLRISMPIYFYRKEPDSITRKKDSSDKQIIKCVRAFLLGTKALHELSNKVELLKNQIYFRVTITSFLNNSLIRSLQERMKMNTQTLYEILHREFFKQNSSTDLTVPIMFSVIDEQQKGLIQAQQQFMKFNQFAMQAQQRIAALEGEIRRLKGQV